MLSRSDCLMRWVVLLLLVSTGVDYCAFDAEDPSSSMSAPGIFSMAGSPQSGAVMRQSARVTSPALPDDDCLCCGAMLIETTPLIVVVDVVEFRPPQTIPIVASVDIFDRKRPPRA